jgi:hypothetical protein
MEVASKFSFDHLWYKHSFSTVASTRSYYVDEFLPNGIRFLFDETNNTELVQKDEKDMVSLDPDLDETGTPSYYSLTGLTTYQGQPSSASTITIVSGSASDTTQKVRIKGLVSSAQNYELLTLNGTTTVAGTLSFSEVTQISKDNTTTGAITVTDTSGSTTLAVIPRFKYASEYQEINFYHIPDDTYTIAVHGMRRPLDMVNSEDLPDLPEMFHEILVTGMLIRGHAYLFDIQRSNELQQIFNAKIAELGAKFANKGGYIPRLQGRQRGPVIEVGRLPWNYQHS